MGGVLFGTDVKMGFPFLIGRRSRTFETRHLFVFFFFLLLAVGVGERFGRLIKRQEEGTRCEKRLHVFDRALLIVSLRSTMIA